MYFCFRHILTAKKEQCVCLVYGEDQNSPAQLTIPILCSNHPMKSPECTTRQEGMLGKESPGRALAIAGRTLEVTSHPTAGAVPREAFSEILAARPERRQTEAQDVSK